MNKDKIILDDYIFRFIYIEAMRDAVIQLAYNGEKKWLMESDVINSLKNGIEVLIEKVINNEYLSQEEYDKDFLNVTINICEFINNKAKNREFTFGNAQKLINIMLKYFYITSYKNDELKVNFKFCHCPMDRELLRTIWDKCAGPDRFKKLGKYTYFLKNWGNEDFEKDENGTDIYPKRYLLFQETVRYFAKEKDINPLEFDYYVW